MSHTRSPTRRAPQLTSWGPAPIISVHGSPYRQGNAHGQAARDAILFNLGAVRRDIAEDNRCVRAYDYDGALNRHLKFLERHAPEILDEIHGIADGAKVPFRNVLLLNVPVFIAAQFLPQDCTQILLMPPATADGRTHLAKTRDLGHGGFKQVVLHRCLAQGLELIEVNTAGSVTWPGSGLSSHGLAISTSGVWSRRTVVDMDRIDRGWFLINTHALLRDSRSLTELEEQLRAHLRVTGLNVVAADRHNGAAFEVTADEVVRHPARDGVVVRTNHYLAPGLVDVSPRQDENPSSYHRHVTATTRLRQRHGTWTVDDLIALLGDHDGYPQQSICRHAEAGEGADTVYASIATVPDGQFWTVLDHPCRASPFASADAEKSHLATTAV